MNIRYYVDPETGQPHIYRHGVTENEVEDVLQNPREDRPGREGARVAIGQTQDREAFDSLSAAAPSEGKKMRKNKFPPGWNEERVRRVLAHYEEQTEEESVAEDEAAFEDSTQTVIEVSKELLPAIRELIAKHKESRRA